jgi:hypothetical protein
MKYSLTESVSSHDAARPRDGANTRDTHTPDAGTARAASNSCALGGNAGDAIVNFSHSRDPLRDLLGRGT